MKKTVSAKTNAELKGQTIPSPKVADPRERGTELYIYCMLLVYPLFTGFHGYARVTASKFWFFAGATGLWLLFLLVCELRAKDAPRFKTLSAVEKLVCAYLALCIVSAFLSPDRVKTLLGTGRYDGLLTTALCCLLFFGVTRFGRPKLGFIYAAALGACLNCFVAVLQLFGKNPLWLFPNHYTFFGAGVYFSSVFLGTIGNADLFSAYLCLVLPMAAGWYLVSGKTPAVFLPAAGLMAVCLFACGVSSGLLAFALCVLLAAPFLITDNERLRRTLELSAVFCLAAFLASPLRVTTPEGGGAVSVPMRFSQTSFFLLAGAAVFVLLRFWTAKKEFRSRSLRRFFGWLSAGIVVLGIAAVYFYSGNGGTMYELSQVLHGHIEDSYGSSRVRIWRRTLALFREHPLFGGGPGTIAERLDVGFSRVVPETGKTLKSFADNAHNVYLGILANTGVFSFAAYLAAMAVSLHKALKCWAPLTAPFALALLCFWIQDFFGLGLFLVTPIMWILWGLLARTDSSE